eukprot:1157397-Pelagomonas_calceolata.AAC.11
MAGSEWPFLSGLHGDEFQIPFLILIWLAVGRFDWRPSFSCNLLAALVSRQMMVLMITSKR